MGLHILQIMLYSHRSNVSTERLEMLFWTSRLGLVAMMSQSCHSKVSVLSQSWDSDILALSRYHTSHLQRWSVHLYICDKIAVFHRFNSICDQPSTENYRTRYITTSPINVQLPKVARSSVIVTAMVSACFAVTAQPRVIAVLLLLPTMDRRAVKTACLVPC